MPTPYCMPQTHISAYVGLWLPEPGALCLHNGTPGRWHAVWLRRRRQRRLLADRDAIDNEIAFVRAIIRRQLNADLDLTDATFLWDKPSSIRFNAKGYLASNWLCYE
jgi:hypothetical protein